MTSRKPKATAPGADTKAKGPACPMCGKPKEAQFRPFCSKRCADLDLGKWLNEDYRLPAVEPPDDWDGEDIEPESQTRH